MTDEHEGTGHMRAVHQHVEVRGHRAAVLRDGHRLTPASAGPIVDAHLRVARYNRRNPFPIGTRLAEPRFEQNGGSAGASATQMKPVSTDINQLARCDDATVERLSDRFVAPSNSGQGIETEKRVHHPPSRA